MCFCVCILSCWSSPFNFGSCPAFYAKTAKVSFLTSEELVQLYDQKGPLKINGKKQKTLQNFFDPHGRPFTLDVYNPTQPFSAKVHGEVKEIMYARVEDRKDELHTVAKAFEKKTNSEGFVYWQEIGNAPTFQGQDPFYTSIGNEHILGVVQVEKILDTNEIRYRTVFYRGEDIASLREFAVGPWGMKDIRLLEINDGKIFVATRPQQNLLLTAGRGKMGYILLNNLEELTPEKILAAEIIEGLWGSEEWGGANQLLSLSHFKIGIIGHIARFDSQGARHYYPVSFTFDLKTKKASELKILATRKDMERGFAGNSKREDLIDVLFSGGITISENRVTLVVGAGDAEIHFIFIEYPF